jgi:hypothetical protein
MGFQPVQMHNGITKCFGFFHQNGDFRWKRQTRGRPNTMWNPINPLISESSFGTLMIIDHLMKMKRIMKVDRMADRGREDLKLKTLTVYKKKKIHLQVYR